MSRFEKESIIVLGRVCTCLNSLTGREIYQYSDRVILSRKSDICSAHLYAAPVATETSPHRQPAIAFGVGPDWEDAVKNLAAGLRRLADSIDSEPIQLSKDP